MKSYKMKKYLSFQLNLLGALLFVCFVAKAQSTSSLLQEVTHHSPNASSLGKFGEVPVGYYTGVPNISVPIYEATSGPLKVPVSLDYHAGGVRVEELASNVGLSWALQAGGIITRGVRGLPDHQSTWYGVPVENRMETHMINGTTGLEPIFLANIENGAVDGEADIFNFNFGGHSGKFIFDQGGNIHIIPQSNLLITEYLLGWKIVDEKGTQYLFQKTETSVGLDSDVETSWLLTSIISNDGKHNITLSYDQVPLIYRVLIGENKYFTVGIGCDHCNEFSNTGINSINQTTYSQRLTKIDFELGYINFNYLNERCDLWGDKTLDEIEIHSKAGALIKKFLLAHSYFGDSSSCDAASSNLRRLKLNSVTEATASITKPPYIFSYDESAPLPDRLSTSQDHWGYYNGATNSTLVPGFTSNDGTNIVNFLGANRNTNPVTAQLGVLKSIQYPTGGATNFTYESNMVNDDRFQEAPSYEERSLLYSIPQNPPYVLHAADLGNPLSVMPMVIPPGGSLVYNFHVEGLDGDPWSKCVWLTKNGQPFIQLSNSPGSSEYGGFFDEGTYGLALDPLLCPPDALVPHFSVSMQAKVPIYPEQSNNLYYVGGLRVKKIEDMPGEGGMPVVREFKYTQEADATKSSGFLINMPIYRSNLNIVETYWHFFYGVYVPVYQANYTYVVGTSQSKCPLATTSGSYVGYGFVTEVLSNGGENRYTYTAYGNPNNPVMPFAPFEFNDWQRGFLESVKSYTKIGNQLSLTKEISNSPVTLNYEAVYGLKLGRTTMRRYTGDLTDVPVADQPLPVFAYYPTETRFFALGSTSEKLYPEPGNLSKVIERKNEYTYDHINFQLTQEKETLTGDAGGSEVQITYKKYPTDYSFNPSSAVVGTEALGLKKLQDVHAIGIPIEEYVVKQYQNTQGAVSNARVISGTLSTFKPDNPYPDQIYKLKVNQPVPLTDFSPSSIVGNSFQKSQLHEPLVKFVTYDGQGNLLTQQKINDVPISYLWGYNNTLPIAEIRNATHASSTVQFTTPESATTTISECTAGVSILSTFEITSAQTITVSAQLSGNGTNVPQSPLVSIRLQRTDGTIVSFLNCSWGQNAFNALVGPGTYQWYYQTGEVGDLVFNNGFTGISLSMTSTYVANKIANRIFYTSFEDDGNFPSAYYTGEKAWQGQYTIYLPADNGNYKVTYMKWLGGSPENWQYVTQDISVTSGTVQPLTIGDAQSIIDEVRLYPAEARITTYSYKPEFGITSSADPNCIVTYYDYDSFGRLKYLKDHKRNVLKSFEYHYKGSH